jgi:hypothetical protein
MPPHDAILPLVLFLALLLVSSLYGLAVSGHFPGEHRSPALRSGAGPVILFGSLVVTATCLTIAIATAWRMVPWPAAVIGGGMMLLAAPLVLRIFPDRFVDGRGALIIFAGASALSAALIIWMTLSG